MEVITTPPQSVSISSTRTTILVAILRELSLSVKIETKMKGKALMTPIEPEEAPREEQYLQISARVLKDASAIRSKSLAKRRLKMILLSQDQ